MFHGRKKVSLVNVHTLYIIYNDNTQVADYTRNQNSHKLDMKRMTKRKRIYKYGIGLKYQCIYHNFDKYGSFDNRFLHKLNTKKKWWRRNVIYEMLNLHSQFH